MIEDRRTRPEDDHHRPSTASAGPSARKVESRRDRSFDPLRPMKLIIQIPCLNEAEQLPATLAELPRERARVRQVEWLVIDDGSTDDTREVALLRRRPRDRLPGQPRPRARPSPTGSRSRCAAAPTSSSTRTPTTSTTRRCIPALVEPILAGEADIVVGDRR